jgi:F0F1-type ATP synthase delta subunit
MNRLTQKKQKARNFARAFLRVQSISEDELFNGIIQLKACLKKSPMVFHMLELSSMHVEEKYQAIYSLTERFEIPRTLGDLLCAVLKYKEFDLLSCILDMLQDEFKRMQGIHEVMVTTSHTMNAEARSVIESQMRCKIPGMLRFIYTLDPALIAGIKIQTPLYYWEHSVARTIRQLQQQLCIQES